MIAIVAIVAMHFPHKEVVVAGLCEHKKEEPMRKKNLEWVMLAIQNLELAKELFT